MRGFSVKFYTDEGNWDFVGNDIPVFFIRDGIQARASCLTSLVSKQKSFTWLSLRVHQ